MSKRKFKRVYKTKKEKKKTSNHLMSIFFVVIMTSSVIGFIWSGQNNSQNVYNGHTLKQELNQWTLQVDGENYRFDFTPESVEDIGIDETITAKIRDAGMIIMTFDPTDDNLDMIDYVRFELAEQLPKATSAYLVTSGVTNIGDKYQLPVFTCANATSGTPVIELGYSNETSIRMEGDCLKIVAAQPNELVAIKDRLLYGILQIIK